MKILKKPRSTLVSVFMAGCACCGFKRAWREALQAYRSTGRDEPLIGPWLGTWKTETNGNSGRLECIVSETDIPGFYQFRYYATWFRFFRGGYVVKYQVSEDQENHIVDGSEDLGFFGKFHHRGKISGNTFIASYSNQKNDIGSFHLNRPQMS